MYLVPTWKNNGIPNFANRNSDVISFQQRNSQKNSNQNTQNLKWNWNSASNGGPRNETKIKIPNLAQLVTSISWVEGPFCAFWMLALDGNFTMPKLDFLCQNWWPWCLTGQYRGILVQWWHPVASSVALDLDLDLPYRVMCSESHQHIATAIKIACNRGTFVLCRRLLHLTNLS